MGVDISQISLLMSTINTFLWGLLMALQLHEKIMQRTKNNRNGKVP
jgi:hypothetical protein